MVEFKIKLFLNFIFPFQETINLRFYAESILFDKNSISFSLKDE